VPEWRVCPLHPTQTSCYVRGCRTAEATWNAKERHKRTLSRNPKLKERHAKYNRDWDACNPGRKSQLSVEWARQNKDRRRETTRQWMEDNAERVVEVRQAWYDANRERVRARGRRNMARRRARKQQNGVEPYTDAELWAQAEAIDWCCYLCGDKIADEWVGEHVLPISRGGADSLSNVMPTCRPCNDRKHATLVADLDWIDLEAVLARLEACGLDPEAHRSSRIDQNPRP
jgi:5-methylcytosine-specific restriction endonuclease McrA